LLKILWNPWRFEYVRKVSRNQDEECLFCRLQRVSEEEGLVVYKGKHSFIALNAYPYNSGHLMIAPYAHEASTEKLPVHVLTEVFCLINLSILALRRAFNPDGFNIGANIGRAAGAGVPGHVHFHVVPRWVGDTNFMPIIADTKPMPISLRDAYTVLKESIEAVLKEHGECPSGV
jgi:ATP adenylyltransferase